MIIPNAQIIILLGSKRLQRQNVDQVLLEYSDLCTNLRLSEKHHGKLGFYHEVFFVNEVIKSSLPFVVSAFFS